MPNILIVDDENDNLKALKRALNDSNPGWNILTALDESAATKIIREQIEKREPVDVVLTDLVMESEQSGMKVLQEARKLDPFIMSILFTAKEKNLDRYAAFDYGAFDVVEKNIRGATAAKEIEIKTRAALRYREWSRRISFLSRYFDPKMFDLIEREPSLLEVKRRLITIVFWDIRGFSLLCEHLKAHPDLIVGFLQEYCDVGARSVFEHNGLLDKFIGDGVMALFGVLNHKDDEGKTDAIAAIMAAQTFRDRFAELTEKWMKKWKLYTPHQIDISLGCGIHTGEVLAGNMGTEFRDQFTAVGSEVNFASRIEGKSKEGRIIISQSTAVRVKDKFKLTPAGSIDDIKNIPGKFELFSL